MKPNRSLIQPFNGNVTADMIARRIRDEQTREGWISRKRRHERNNRIAKAAFYVMSITIMIGGFDWLSGGNTITLIKRAALAVWGMVA